MNFSHVWKGLAVVAVLFLFSMEAVAQLPVRTQRLQLLEPTGAGTITQDFNTPSATTYSVTWPGVSPIAAATDSAILIGRWGGAGTDVNMEWLAIDGFVDGDGALNHVTYWNPDDNSLSAQETFEFNPATGLLGIGVNNTVSGLATIEGATAGSVQIGNGVDETVTIDGTGATVTVGNPAAATPTAGEVTVSSTTQTTINLDGASATATVGGATAAGTVNVTTATGTNGVALDGATGTATLGTGTVDGQLVITDDAGTAVTVETAPAGPTSGALVAWTLQLDTANAGGTYYMTPSTNQSGTAQLDYIYVANGDGTATWTQNPTGRLTSGVETPIAGAYSHAVTFGAGTTYTSAPAVTVTPAGPVANGYVLQVTAVTTAGFTILSSAPFDGADTISWIATQPYNP